MNPKQHQTGVARYSRRTALATAGMAALSATGSRNPVAAQAATPVASPAASPSPAPNPVVASWPHVFGHAEFQFQFLIGLGSAYEQAADVGELFAAASQITDADYDSWYDTFVALGDRVRAIGETSAASGDRVPTAPTEEQIKAVRVAAARMPADLRRLFEDRFAAWKKTWSAPPLVFSSNPHDATHSKEFHGLVALFYLIG